jgi:putative SOS response-associated peptidase YedK
VPADRFDDWLDCSSGDPGTAKRLLDEFPEPHLVPRMVSGAVGNVRNNGPHLIEPADPGIEPAPPQLSF